MRHLSRWLLAVGLLFAVPAAAQNIGGGQPVPTGSTLFTSTGANSWVVPAGVTRILVDACAAGGGNGLGQASASTAGGGGGGSGMCLQGYPASVVPGNTLTVTVGAAVANAGGGNTTLQAPGPRSPPCSAAQLAPLGGSQTPGVGGTGGGGGGPLAGAAARAALGVQAEHIARSMGVDGCGGGGAGLLPAAAQLAVTLERSSPGLCWSRKRRGRRRRRVGIRQWWNRRRARPTPARLRDPIRRRRGRQRNR